jgi:iron(III) transport system ATP-binding protein
MLAVADLRMSYQGTTGTTEAIRGVSFEMPAGEFLTLLGPSGSGKSTTLRCTAGLEQPSSGTITVGTTVVFSSELRVNTPPYKRGLGMVFQSYAIWPHMSVFENVAFPLVNGVTKVSRPEVKRRVMEILSLVQLEDLADRPAPYLSGGQQQRVALARALVLEPVVLLLDEPLSNLDANLREEMRTEIRSLVKRTGTTTLYVTHDQLEALTMSDRVALMKDGLIDQVGDPRSVYQSPRTSFAATFLGRTNIMSGTVAGVDGPDRAARIETPWGVLACSIPESVHVGTPVVVGFRPESAIVVAPMPGEPDDGLVGTIIERTFAGEVVHLEIDLGGRTIHARGDPFVELSVNEAVSVRVPAERCYFLGLASPDAGEAGAAAALDA